MVLHTQSCIQRTSGGWSLFLQARRERGGRSRYRAIAEISPGPREEECTPE